VVTPGRFEQKRKMGKVTENQDGVRMLCGRGQSRGTRGGTKSDGPPASWWKFVEEEERKQGLCCLGRATDDRQVGGRGDDNPRSQYGVS